jgi:hypothetical protein
MQIKFTDERIKEYFEGGIHFTNDGEPIDVSDSQGEEMLKKIHFLDDKEVKVFERVVDEDADTEDAADESSTDDESTPADVVETAEQLSKNRREDLEKMARDEGLDGDSYTNKTELAQAIVAARNAKIVSGSDETEG